MSKALKLSAACFCMFFLADCSRRNVGSEVSLLGACSELEPLVRQQGCQPNLEEECTNEEVQAIADGGGEPFDCSESAMRANGTYGLVECVPVGNRCMGAYKKWRSLQPNADSSNCENKPGFYDSNNDGVCESVFEGYSHCSRGVCTCNSGNGFVGYNCNVQAVTNTVSFPANINDWWFVKNPNANTEWPGQKEQSYWKFYTEKKGIADGVVKYSIDMKGLTDVKSITIPSLVWVTVGFQNSSNKNQYDLPAVVPPVLSSTVPDNTTAMTMFGYLRAVFRNTDDSEFEKQLCEYRLAPGKRIARRGCASVDGKIVTTFAPGEIPTGAKLMRVDAAAKYFDIRSDSFMPTKLKPNACDENKESCMLNCLGNTNKTTCENTCKTSHAACAASPVYQQISVTIEPSTRNVLCTSSFAGTFQGYQCNGVPNNLCRPGVPGTCCGDGYVQSDEMCDAGLGNNVSETSTGSDLTQCTTSCVYVGCNKKDIKANGTYTPFASDDWVTRGSVVALNPSYCPERFGAPTPLSLACEGGRWANNGVFTCSELINQGTASADSLTEDGSAASVVWSLRETPVSPANLVFSASIANELSFTSPMAFSINGVVQTQQISAANDAVDDPDQTVVLSGQVQSEDPRFNGIRLSNNVFNTVNIHHARVLLERNVSTTSEAGPTAQITVSLSVAPSNSITVNVVSSDTTEGTVNPSGVVLDAGRLSANLVLTGQNDDLDDGDIRYDVNFTTSSAATRFNNMVVNSLSFINTDNDTSSLVTSCMGNQTSEQSAVAPVNCVLRLSSQPFNDVNINVSVEDTTEGNVVEGGVLTFTTGNWNNNQTYRVRGMDDLIDDGDIPYNIVFSSSGNDFLYVNAASKAWQSIVNIDDDMTLGNIVIVEEPRPYYTGEWNSLVNSIINSTFSFRLESQPVENVTINLSTTAPDKVSVSPSTVVFTPSNFGTAIPVTLTGKDVDSPKDTPYSIVANATGSLEYHGRSFVFGNMVSIDKSSYSAWMDVSIGSWFACAVDTAWRVLCWGDPLDGVGFQKNVMKRTDTGLLRFKNISAGSVHVCGMTTANEVYCWGANGTSLNYGQTGIGLSKGPASPTNAVVVSVNGQTYRTWKNVSSNFMHTCGILSTNDIYNNTAWCWGNNRFGQLGSNSVLDFSSTPLLVGNESMKWVKIGEGGSAHTCGITDSNKIKCWGYHTKNLIINSASQSNINVPTDVYLIQNDPVANEASWKDVSTGTVFISKPGEWESMQPHKYSEIMRSSTPGVSQSSCAIDMSNNVWCWGYIIGDSTYRNRLSNAVGTSGSVLRKVSAVNGIKATSVSVYRESATVTDTATGALAGFGRNDFCESGIYNAINVSDLRYVNYNDPYVGRAAPFQMKKTKQGLFASCHLTTNNQIICFFENNDNANFWPSLSNSLSYSNTRCVSNTLGDYETLPRPRL